MTGPRALRNRPAGHRLCARRPRHLRQPERGRKPEDGGPGRNRGQHDWTYERVLETFPRLKERLGHGGQQLSGGEQQMLTIGRALMTNPDVLILDEATEGLAPLIAREIWRICARDPGHRHQQRDRRQELEARDADHRPQRDPGQGRSGVCRHVGRTALPARGCWHSTWAFEIAKPGAANAALIIAPLQGGHRGFKQSLTQISDLERGSKIFSQILLHSSTVIR